MRCGSICRRSKGARRSVHLALFPDVAEIVPGNVSGH